MFHVAQDDFKLTSDLTIPSVGAVGKDHLTRTIITLILLFLVLSFVFEMKSHYITDWAGIPNPPASAS